MHGSLDLDSVDRQHSLLTRVGLALSRDEAEKIYIQPESAKSLATFMKACLCNAGTFTCVDQLGR